MGEVMAANAGVLASLLSAVGPSSDLSLSDLSSSSSEGSSWDREVLSLVSLSLDVASDGLLCVWFVVTVAFAGRCKLFGFNSVTSLSLAAALSGNLLVGFVTWEFEVIVVPIRS